MMKDKYENWVSRKYNLHPTNGSWRKYFKENGEALPQYKIALHYQNIMPFDFWPK